MSGLDSGLGKVTERKGARRGRLAISTAEGTAGGALIVLGILKIVGTPSRVAMTVLLFLLC